MGSAIAAPVDKEVVPGLLATEYVPLMMSVLRAAVPAQEFTKVTVKLLAVGITVRHAGVATAETVRQLIGGAMIMF